MIDRGVVLPGVKVFPPAALHAKATAATSPIDKMRAYLIGSLRRLESEGARYFDPRAPVEKVNGPRLILKLSRWFCWAAEPGTWSRCPLSRFTDG
jgi:hypothetical protein